MISFFEVFALTNCDKSITPVMLSLPLAWKFDSLSNVDNFVSLLIQYDMLFLWKCFYDVGFDITLFSWIFDSSYFKPLVTPLFMQLFWNNVFTFMFCFSFETKQTSNFHTLNIWTDIVRIVAVQMLTIGSHN